VRVDDVTLKSILHEQRGSRPEFEFRPNAAAMLSMSWSGGFAWPDSILAIYNSARPRPDPRPAADSGRGGASFGGRPTQS
jgi:hypothetical protein